MSESLSNPAAIATIAAGTPQGQKAIGQATTALKVVLLVAGGIIATKYAYKKYLDYRSNKYANDNVGNPNLIAAAVIFNSFKRFEFPGVLGYLLPSIDISTNEDALNLIATQINNIKAVSDAYKTLFQRNLFFDTQNGLDTEEMQTFWNRINAPAQNNESTSYATGTKLYAAIKLGNTQVNKAEYINGQWQGNNELYGNFKYGDFIGEVIFQGKVTPQNANGAPDLVGQNYYIVKQLKSEFQCLWSCDTGVVVQTQVSNVKGV